jgi:bile acid:Na+ symporter, BASS family
MQTTIVTTLLLPLALGVIMFGLGLHLKPKDFARVITAPKPVAIGLATQMLVLPPIAWLIAVVFRLPPELAVGMLLLAASPGGATANVFSHLAKGDVALNITLTAINSLLILLTLPLIVGWAMAHFLGAEAHVPPPVQKVVEVGVIILAPVGIGMLVRAFAARAADAIERVVRPLSLLILLSLIVLTVVREWALLTAHAAQIGSACLLLSVLSLAIGYGVARALKLNREQGVAISFEIGIHNTTLAIFIALSVLERPALSVPAALYSLVMYFTAGAAAWWFLRQAKTA